MKFKYLTPLIILIGIVVLFFFPEPETNFLAYIGTALIFIMLTIFSIIWKKRKKDGNKTEKI
jgi:L-asparagine transporter-like permease